AVAVVVPVVQFRGADEHPQRADGQPDIGMNVDRPNAPEGNETGQGLQGETEDESREVDESQGVNRIERVLAVSSKPVEMFGAVVDGMDPPKQADAVLEAMAPVNEEVAQEHHFDGLEPPRLRCHAVPETLWYYAVEPGAEVCKRPQNKAGPKHILAEEETEVG